MDFSLVEFPITVSTNTLKAYFNISSIKLPKTYRKSLLTPTADVLTIPTNQPKSLRHIVLDAIAENWEDNPILKEIPRQEDRNYVLSILNVNIPLKILCLHISDEFFWRKCYQYRWKIALKPIGRCDDVNNTPADLQKTIAKSWINIYMERHLQEYIERVEPTEYDVESVQQTLDICASYINQLEINCLQPSMDGHNDHIPLDFILSNLPELHTLRLTYCTKTAGTNFYLGCNMLSSSDIHYFSRGLSQCHELLHFCFYSTKLESYQLKFLARSLDKGCHNLTRLSLDHCAIGDEGINQFVQACNNESFSNLRVLSLANNKITAEGAYVLSRILKGLKLTKIFLRLNPIQSDGAATIFSVLQKLPLQSLDVGGCYLCGAIIKSFMQLLVQNKTLESIDISNNELGEDFGKQVYKIIGFNKTLHTLDVRNSGLPLELRKKLIDILQKNVKKSCFL